MLAGRMWFACDTHVHTSISSYCSTPPEEVVRAAKQRGLGLIGHHRSP
jgi:predicted metal-dependent phosphoesterase TrpH